MTTVGTNELSVLKGNVVSLDRIRMDNASTAHAITSYAVSPRWPSEVLPNHIHPERFSKGESNNEQEVNVLLNAVKCRKAMWLQVYSSKFTVDDTSILDDYVDDTLLTFDYETGKNIFDEKAYKKDLHEYESKQKLLIDEHNRLVEQVNIVNAITTTEQIKAIKSKIAELQSTQPKKEDAKYNHPEIVKGETTVAEVLNRYKELHALERKYKKEWDDYQTSVQHNRAGHLDISEDTFKVFKELCAIEAFSSNAININNTLYKALQYESVADYNENNWKSVSFDGRDESRNFLNQKRPKLWSRFGQYIDQFYAPDVVDWLLYDHFTDKDFTWLRALESFVKRVIALKDITK